MLACETWWLLHCAWTGVPVILAFVLPLVIAAVRDRRRRR